MESGEKSLTFWQLGQLFLSWPVLHLMLPRGILTLGSCLATGSHLRNTDCLCTKMIGGLVLPPRFLVPVGEQTGVYTRGRGLHKQLFISLDSRGHCSSRTQHVSISMQIWFIMKEAGWCMTFASAHHFWMLTAERILRPHWFLCVRCECGQ